MTSEPTTLGSGTPIAKPTILLNKTSDLATQAAAGRVFLEHAHLDYMLKMLAKSLSGLPLLTVQKALQWTGSKELRDIVVRLGRQHLARTSDLLQLKALMQACADVTQKRNEYAHGIWAQQVDLSSPHFDGKGDDIIFSDGKVAPAPTVEQLDKLHDEIARLVATIMEARYSGFIATSERKPAKAAEDVFSAADIS